MRSNPRERFGVSIPITAHIIISPRRHPADGTVYTVRALLREDLNRQLVKSSTCTIEIPEFELTIPAGKGQLTTIEGLICDVVADLSADQPLRRIENEAAYTKIQTIIDGFREILADNEDEEVESKEPLVQKALEKDTPMKPFTLRLDDPSGNSFIEFLGSMADPKWNMRMYHRTREQNIALGLVNPDEPEAPKPTSDQEQIGGGLEGENEEIYRFPGTCSSCGYPLDTLVKKVNIPYFKVCRPPLAYMNETHVVSTGYLDHVDKL